MNTFLGELGTNLSDRILKALTLPGLLWTACLALGWQLSQGDALDFGRISHRLGRYAATGPSNTDHALSATALTLALALLIASAAGLAANGIASAVEWLWGEAGVSGLTHWLVRRRRKRWDQAVKQVRSTVQQAVLARREQADPRAVDDRARAMHHRLVRISPRRPERPTWIGDRFALTVDRARDVNGVDDIDLVWPRLWTFVPEVLRGDITAARDAYAGAARLCGWGLMYVPISVIWWPAAPVVLVLLAAGSVRGRRTATAFADLVETALDLYLDALAKQLQVDYLPGTPRVEQGAEITKRLRHR
jgi:uncharacterized RDD family membrane protein YckC